jgi:hypothetical protein
MGYGGDDEIPGREETEDQRKAKLGESRWWKGVGSKLDVKERLSPGQATNSVRRAENVNVRSDFHPALS